MATVTCLDTHVTALLANGKIAKLSKTARKLIETAPLRISPMVRLELAFLYEIGRMDKGPDAYLPALMREINITWCATDFTQAVDSAMSFSWTHDPFDRLIVGHAAAEGARLITKDEKILKYYRNAIW